MTFVSYAQNFEDVRLWRAFKDVTAGRYLDIGTQDPVQDSVSLAFYERGWRGVHVEPTPTYAAALRAARPDETIIEAAVSAAPGPLRFFEIPQTGLSTGNTAIAAIHREAGWECREIIVPTVSLASIFDLMGPDLVHWLKIDVEGMEADVLASWGDHSARPAALIIEATVPGTQQPAHESWHRMVTGRGYTDVLFDGLSRYFVHETHRARGEALALSPNVFDGYQIHQNHFAASYLGQKRVSELAAMREEAAVERDRQAAALADLAAESAEVARSQAAAIALAQNAAAANERALAETATRLDALLQDHVSLARENGRLDGQIAAQSATHAARLSEAADIRRLLARRLSLAEDALTSAQSDVTALRAMLDRQTLELEGARTDILALNDRLAQLQHRIAWREKQLRTAAALIEAVPQPLAGLPRLLAALVRPWMSAAHSTLIANNRNALDKLRSELLLPPASEVSHGDPGAAANQTDVGFVAGEYRGFEMMESDGPITSVPMLLAPHDRNFIRAAYQAVLGRAPDPEGEAYYLSRLRTGTHKLAILKQLRRSPEGKAFIPGVAGLDRAIKRHVWATLPILGILVRLLRGDEGNSATHRALRVLANDVGRLRSDHFSLRAEQVALTAAVRELSQNAFAKSDAAPHPVAGTMTAASATSENPGSRRPDIGAGQANLGRHASRLLGILASNIQVNQAQRSD